MIRARYLPYPLGLENPALGDSAVIIHRNGRRSSGRPCQGIGCRVVHVGSFREPRTFWLLLPWLALQADVPVERHRSDAEVRGTARGAPSPGQAAPRRRAARAGRLAVGRRAQGVDGASWAFDSPNFRPSFRPRARAASGPATVRSWISSRPNSASAPRCRTRGGRPQSWCRAVPLWPASTRKPTPRVDRSCTVLTRWARFRPRRSSFQTTSTSPLRRGPQASACVANERLRH